MEGLNEKYPDLSGSKPVERAVSKVRREGEKVEDKKKDEREIEKEKIVEAEE